MPAGFLAGQLWGIGGLTCRMLLALAPFHLAIENHGAITSNPEILLRLIHLLTLPNFGILPISADKYSAV